MISTNKITPSPIYLIMKLLKICSKRPLFLLLGFLIVLSCGKNSDKSGDTGFIEPEKQEFEATLQENTASVSKSVMNDLVSYDEKTGTYIFASNSGEIEDLKLGMVVLFEAHSLRKIKSVTNDDGNTIIETEFAKLTDYFKDAKINYSALVDWNDTSTGAINMKVGQPIVTMATPMLGLKMKNSALETNNLNFQNEFGVKFKREIRGWKVEFELKPEAGGKLKIKLVAEKERRCSITAEGFISSFTSNANIVIENGNTQNFSYSNDGLEGEIEIKFAAVGLGSDIAQLEIPAKIERTILVYGIIPVTLRLKANLQIYPEVAVGSSSQVSMKLTYNSTMGFAYEAGRVRSDGDIRGENAEQTGDSNTATAGIAGMGVSVEFPRFEIGILGNVVVPYLLLKTHTSSYLSTGLLDNTPCHFAEMKYKGHAGVTLNFLNLVSINNDYKLFDKKKRWEADGSHCD